MQKDLLSDRPFVFPSSLFKFVFMFIQNLTTAPYTYMLLFSAQLLSMTIQNFVTALFLFFSKK